MEQKDSAYISIIVPIHNNEKYLKECLNSIANQTLREIEIICVDDYSEDSSYEILKSYEIQDTRFKIIKYSENKSANQARKDGVLCSTGKYIMFVDGDDYLNTNACEILLKAIESSNSEIVQFGTNVINWDNLPNERVKSMENYLEPYTNQLFGLDIIFGCFINRLFSYNLWNKIFDAQLVRRASQYIENGYYPKAQDLYFFFTIAFFAKSYNGIKQKYYNYRFGSGITGHNVLTRFQYAKYIGMANVISAIDHFLDDRQLDINSQRLSEDTALELTMSYRRILLGDMFVSLTRLKRQYRNDALKRLRQNLGICDYIAGIERAFNINPSILFDSEVFAQCDRKEIKTVAAFLPRVGGGGAQHVMAMLANTWVEMGYRVVVITEKGYESSKDFHLDNRIKRRYLTQYIALDGYVVRGYELYNIIQEEGIDVLVYHAWLHNALPWDMLLCNMLNVRFVVHCHNIFACGLLNLSKKPVYISQYYRYADSIITLNDVDTCFWEMINPNVFQTNNPIENVELKISSDKYDYNNICWIGRFASEKRPLDAIKAMDKICKVFPQANLYMLGEISDAQIEYYNRTINDLNYSKNIHICGYVNNVQDYLDKCGIMIVTSEYEGFHLGIVEALARGTVVVMYDLPYISYKNGCKGVISVENGNIEELSEKVISLLKDRELQKKLGNEGSLFCKQIIDFDQELLWKKVFNFNDYSVTYLSNTIQYQTVHTLFDFYQRGIDNVGKKKHFNGVIDINNILSRKIAFFGCGRRLKRFVECNPSFRAEICIDNNPNIIGQTIEGLPVVSIYSIKELREFFILITPANSTEIMEQLVELGLDEGKDYIEASAVLSLE